MSVLDMDGGDSIADAGGEAILSWNVGTGEAVSQAVVDAISAVTGQDVLDLEPTLYDSLDPDALNNLFAGRANRNDPENRIVFAYAGFELEVFADRRIDVYTGETASGERNEEVSDVDD